MPNEVFIAENDALLRDFLSAEDESLAENELNRLFEETIIPQIQQISTSFLTFTSLEKDEIQSDVQIKILKKLRILHENANGQNSLTNPVKDFLAYISTTTFNCRKDFILAKQPEWRRNNNRLRRLQEEESAEWEFFTDESGRELVLLKGNSRKIETNLELEEITARVREAFPNHLFLKIQEFVPIILEKAEGALTKNSLLKAISEITETGVIEEIGMTEETSDYLKHNDNEYLLSKRQKDELQRIWAEINMFPPHQKKVLILGLRESQKVEAITLFLVKRIATIEEIAAALEVGLKEFSDIFERLPMSSSEIADFLGIEDGEKTSKEQKVENLRSIARNLLRRRLGIKK